MPEGQEGGSGFKFRNLIPFRRRTPAPEASPVETRHPLVDAVGEFTVKKERGENQDVRLSLPNKGLFGVFDGRGKRGRHLADIARNTYDEEMKNFPSDESNISLDVLRTSLETYMKRAHTAIKSAQSGSSEDTGTTASIVKLWQAPDGTKKAIFVWVGDSGGYIRKKDGTFEKVTRDDDLAKEALGDTPQLKVVQNKLNSIEKASELDDNRNLLAPGQSFIHPRTGEEMHELTEAEVFRNRHLLTQSLDALTDDITVNVEIRDIEEGDLVIVATDGVDNLTLQRKKEIIDQNPAPQAVAQGWGTQAKTKGLEKWSAVNYRVNDDDATTVAVAVA